MNKESLRKTLQQVDETIPLYDLSKKLQCAVDDILILIQDDIMPLYRSIFKKNSVKIPFFNEEKVKDFFSCEIVDMGFLCQYKIKELKEDLDKKLQAKNYLGIFAHQNMYNNWLMYRGY